MRSDADTDVPRQGTTYESRDDRAPDPAADPVESTEDRSTDDDVDNRFGDDRQPGFSDADEDRIADDDHVDPENRLDPEDGVDPEDRVDTEDRVDAGDRLDTDRVDADRVDADHGVDEYGAGASAPDAVGQAAVPYPHGEPVPTPDAVGQPDQTATDQAATDQTATDLKPGEAAQAATAATTWQQGQADEYRERWRQVQVRFLDEPQAAAQEAERLVGEVLDGLTRALAGQKNALDGWRSADRQDTEQLRVSVRGYRDLLDRVLAL
jgi:hypothetical protein